VSRHEFLIVLDVVDELLEQMPKLDPDPSEWDLEDIERAMLTVVDTERSAVLAYTRRQDVDA